MKSYRLMLFSLIVTLLAVTAIAPTPTTSAQNGYAYITSAGGVEAYWRVKKPEYGSKRYEVLYKFVNKNSQSVEVKYTANFRCGVTGQGKEDSGLFVLAASGTQSGELNGLYTYPCEDGSDPAEIFLKMRITDQECVKACRRANSECTNPEMRPMYCMGELARCESKCEK